MGFNLLVIGVIVLVFGISLFFPARSARKHDQIREGWPTAKGTVTSSELVAQPPLVSRLGKEILQYDAVVKYQFRSGGQLHFGSAVSYPRYLHTKEQAERIAARYPAGAAVTVHHNPEDVRECYLEIEKTARNYRTSIACMVAGGVLTLIGLLTGAG
ncbi:MAG: hypothetical protein A3K46_08660 [Chloroflexi bacterium RBG_13_60_9]|nr:MAG: hypothetical protein A3K46_08660 [Chloroflexi bacterium RBG_13_60_9]